MTEPARGEPLLLELLDGFLQTKVLITAPQRDLFTAAADEVRALEVTQQ